MSRRDEDLAYGDYNTREGEEGDRGLLGDVGRRFGFGKKENTGSQPSSSNQGSSGGMSFFKKIHDPLHGFVSDLKDAISGDDHAQKPPAAATTYEQGGQPQPGQEYHEQHRFLSFAPERHGNEAKWYVDGCSYMYAVSIALERAKESIWILDWWLSPELYLRRPPAKNQQYRVDRMLHAAAERGVKVNIIVYKEVTQALTRKLLNPILPNYLHSLLPNSTDWFTKGLVRLGLDVIFKSLEEWERTDPLIASPITVSSSHTKHHLEDLHPNIGVFRHPDHLPDAAVLQSDLFASLKNMSLSPAKLVQLPGDGLKALYGAHEGTVMYWAHHEKLCLVDGHTAFMGGLDLCYGRWDTNQHSIADAHPGNVDRIVFPGQDFNNARMLDFQDVSNWENNKLDRTESSRMGWSDVALCLSGPVVQDLRTHFSQRWNFIYDEKYSKKATRYARLPETSSGAQQSGVYPPPPMQQRGIEGEEEGERGFGGEEGDRGLFGRTGGLRQKMQSKFEQYEHGSSQGQQQSHVEHSAQRGGVECQIARSAAKWSHNLVNTEHSIQNAYCEVIRNSKHFVYIENQFFITATGDQQKPIRNKIGAAIVERIVRAAQNGEKYKMIILIPSVPAFAGDLKLDEALGTRAIMEFQYDSINRGGHSIYEEIAKAGFNPMDYIRFYNLRSYDRINSSQVMRETEERSGVSYNRAQEGFDAVHDSARDYQAYRPPPTQEYGVYEMEGSSAPPLAQQGNQGDYERYQQEASKVGGRQGLGDGRWDTVSECYMLGGEDIRNVPWEGSPDSEMDAFVSEELYIHSKLLIADDQIVICGSANLNDRSQLGDHDSEIAIIIQDPKPIDSQMNGQPYRASEFAASLRREIFRKHLGLLKPQDMERPDANYEPIGIPNKYDWGSDEDRQVVDPLSDDFLGMWNWRAHTNTQAFGKVFHPVPTDEVRNWKQYDEYYSRFFGQDQKAKENKKPSLYKWGHVVAENFSQGEQGVREVKEVLSTIKGTLVEMPLLFLKEEDIAKEGVELNALTEEIYT
ncbi:Phospholipase D/nuclease [Pyrenophora tritici-repentis]|uniref:Phospholipase n=1 Tax=Pyrenophora tritici-repentis TaxID=45151 RepID=A0A2W1D842_9PLEO|nr:Phospholipase D/nuclease [Pyrenophora tritici-repentis]KAF7450911.1 Phospholipase D/nuclease [Pyrenophora tritici-repentis]KAF7573579.1 phospholipase D Active site motif protein [Pyrenophora tritici-repentis]KAG9380881.1 Phospholipase D/nuclease [Pyrenophora tritici-repentis]KAI0577881.1 Phospholipase D/nuclease [Pyrenophora tritici-repentis]